MVFLVVLWPTRQSGARLLRTWGIAEPSASARSATSSCVWCGPVSCRSAPGCRRSASSRAGTVVAALPSGDPLTELAAEYAARAAALGADPRTAAAAVFSAWPADA